MAESRSSEFLVAEGKRTAFAVIKDNKSFTEKFIPFSPPSIKVTKTVVVGQDPASGAFVPAGTPIKLTLAPKEILPLEQFDINPKFKERYPKKNIGEVFEDFKSNQPAKLVIEQAKDYEVLAPSELQQVKLLIAEKFGLDAQDPNFDDAAKGVYKDLQFLQKL